MLIKEYQTKEYLDAMAWGEKHPDLIAKKENPFDFLDEEWELWERVKYIEHLSSLSADQQRAQFNADQHMLRKMSSK